MTRSHFLDHLRRDDIVVECPDAVRDLLELQPDDVRITNAIAKHHLKYKDFDKTEAYVNEILEKRPNYFPARMVKAELLLARRQFDEAIQLLNPLINEEPNSARAHYLMGLAHIGKGETRLAKADLGRTLELSPNHIKSRLLLAVDVDHRMVLAEVLGDLLHDRDLVGTRLAGCSVTHVCAPPFASTHGSRVRTP